MVYDEGISIEFEEYTFFAFSKYSIENIGSITLFKSKCYSTCVGWFLNKNKRGCFKATKRGVNPLTDTFINTKKGIINIELGTNIHSFSFMETKHELFNSKSDYYKNHNKYANRLNKYTTKNWTAGANPQFHDKSINELNKFAGLSRFKSFSKKKANPYLNILVKPINTNNINTPFPINFDWAHLLKPSASQKNCGSCYAISTLRMIEARLKILYHHDVSLSVQHVLDCSYYNQGCNGGYAFLTMKFASEFELIPEFCQPYLAVDGKCMDSCDLFKLPYIYKVSNYKYLGGSYGKCSESVMIEELYHNGPFVVSFEPDYNFMLYKSGVYHDVEYNRRMNKPEWEKVDHSVLLVGWGVDELTGEKYWMVQNTWGDNWGENGFFRIRRGTDEFAIESICEAGTPYIVENITKMNVMPDKNNKILPDYFISQLHGQVQEEVQRDNFINSPLNSPMIMQKKYIF